MLKSNKLSDLEQDILDFTLIEDKLKKFCEKKRIRFIPLVSGIKNKAKEFEDFTLYYKKDKHLTRLGHLILTDILIENNIL